VGRTLHFAIALWVGTDDPEGCVYVCVVVACGAAGGEVSLNNRACACNQQDAMKVPTRIVR
jgi:hypothetical protein